LRNPKAFIAINCDKAITRPAFCHKIYFPESYPLTPMPMLKAYITWLLAILLVVNIDHDKKIGNANLEKGKMLMSKSSPVTILIAFFSCL